MPNADPRISLELERAFVRQGIETHTNTYVNSIRPQENQLVVEHTGASQMVGTVVDGVFFAVGWPPNVEHLGLEAAGIRPQRQGIPVDAYLRTEVDHIFAPGDINGRSMLVPVARLEGRVAAQNALRGPSREVTYDLVPSASFTDPEYGGVGLTEPAATRDHDIVVGIAPYDDLLRPVADGHEEGFCKLIADRNSQRDSGAHVLGDTPRRSFRLLWLALRLV